MGETYSSPTSFVGATRRMLAWRGPLKLAAIVLLPAVWVALVGWYVVAFGVFGIVTVPLRLLRRGQRRELAVQRAQLEELRRLGADRQ